MQFNVSFNILYVLNTTSKYTFICWIEFLNSLLRLRHVTKPITYSYNFKILNIAIRKLDPSLICSFCTGIILIRYRIEWNISKNPIGGPIGNDRNQLQVDDCAQTMRNTADKEIVENSLRIAITGAGTRKLFNAIKRSLWSYCFRITFRVEGPLTQERRNQTW